jgi:hypothetical protein
VQQFRICVWRNNVVTGLHLEQKTRDLPNLLADDNITSLFWVRCSVNRIKFVTAMDVGKVLYFSPSNSRVATFDEMLSVSSAFGADAPYIAHAVAA